MGHRWRIIKSLKGKDARPHREHRSKKGRRRRYFQDSLARKMFKDKIIEASIAAMLET